MWRELRAKRLGGVKWRRWTTSAPIPAEFFCYSARIAVILDDGGERDANRVALVKKRGWRVLRARPQDVVRALDRICAALRKASGGADQVGVREDGEISFLRDRATSAGYASCW